MNTTSLPTYTETAVDTALPVMAVPGTDVEMSLSGVSFQIFPLKASMARLTEFCDLYLNCTHETDRPPFFFRPALPYVLLQIVDYGRMAIEWQNMGWFGARELCFTIPLEIYRRCGNELVFCDWATIAPFIFADNPLSVRNGREVYGWPKVAMKMESLTPILDPLDLDLVIRLKLEVPTRPGTAENDKYVPFLDVVREPAPFQSIRRGSGDLLTAVPNAMAKSMLFMSDAARSFADLGASRYEEFRDLGYLQAASDMGFQYLRAVLPRVTGDRRISPFPQPIGYEGSAINLKQFRDAENPGTACYQAITLSKMTLERLNDAGPLLDLKAGDPPSGRFKLRLFRYALQPIVENLGLEIAEHASVGDWEVAVLEPQMPFWMNADLSYGQGETLCWRSRCSGWSEDIALPQPDPNYTGIPYVPLGSGALQEIAGPFTFPTLTVRVLPMKANQWKLDEYCKGYLKDSSDHKLDKIPYRLESWGSYVYLLAATYDGLTAKLNSAGLATDREVAIVVPVKVYRGADMVSVALLPVFAFDGCQISAITDREVFGRPALLSEMKSPPTNWMDAHSHPERLDQPLLEILTKLLPSDYVGAEAAERSVLEIHMGQVPLADDPHSKSLKPLWEWAHTLLGEYRRKKTTADQDSDALEIVEAAMLAVLLFRIPILSIALKEFMDAEDLQKACLQALVQVIRSIESVDRVGEFAHPLHIVIPKYDTLPIVETLGLEVKWTTIKWDPEIGYVETDVIEPIRPFWINMAMAGTNGENLCLRAGTEKTWHTNKSCKDVPPVPPFGETHKRLPFGSGLLKKLAADWGSKPLEVIFEEWLRDMLEDEFEQIRQTLGDDPLRAILQGPPLNLRGVPADDDDQHWAAFVNSFRIEELLRTVDLIEDTNQGLDDQVSQRYTPKQLADALAKIDPQMAFEDILSQDWIWHPGINPPNADGDPPPAYRIPRDSAGPYFQQGQADWTDHKDDGNDSWYWEK